MSLLRPRERPLHEVLSEKEAAFEALNLLIQSVYGSPDRATLAERVVSAMKQYAGSPAVCLFEVDETAREARLVTASGFSDEAIQAARRIVLNGTLTGAAVAQRDVLCCQDLASDELVPPSVRTALVRQGMRSVFVVPLVASTRVLGTVSLVFTESRLLTDTTRRALRSIGATIGLAMANMDTLAELRAGEERFRQALEAARAGAWFWDIQSDAVQWSPENYELLGLSPGEVEPSYRLWLNSVHPDDRDAAQQHVETAVRERGALDIEYRVVWPDGTVRWINDAGQLVLNAQGEPTGMYGIQRDITRLKLGELALRRSEQQLRDLGANREQLLEAERARVSREIHDELGQALTVLKLDLVSLQMDALANDARGTQRVHHALQLIDQTVDAVHRIAAELRPAVLDHFGLAEAIRWQLTEFEQTTGVAVEAHGVQSVPAMSDTRTTAVFRILQEALTNVARHAQAREVTVSLEAEGEVLKMAIRDDGRGFVQEEVENKHSFGVLGMQERAHSLGGLVRLEGVPGRGAVVTLRMPLGPAQPEG
ncbi:MAG: PAS domain-containing protein [Gemmatimonadota bacterium]|nr:PAS domain-containing protein [Gemmatimonadota bacterium]